MRFEKTWRHPDIYQFYNSLGRANSSNSAASVGSSIWSSGAAKPHWHADNISTPLACWPTLEARGGSSKFPFCDTLWPLFSDPHFCSPGGPWGGRVAKDWCLDWCRRRKTARICHFGRRPDFPKWMNRSNRPKPARSAKRQQQRGCLSGAFSSSSARDARGGQIGSRWTNLGFRPEADVQSGCRLAGCPPELHEAPAAPLTFPSLTGPNVPHLTG